MPNPALIPTNSLSSTNLSSGWGTQGLAVGELGGLSRGPHPAACGSEAAPAAQRETPPLCLRRPAARSGGSIGIAPLQPRALGRGNNAQTNRRCQRGEETLSRQKVPLRNNISVSACTMLSCPALLSRLYGKYYINGFVQIDS